MYSKMIFPLPYWILMAPAVNFDILHLAELQHSVISLYPIQSGVTGFASYQPVK